MPDWSEIGRLLDFGAVYYTTQLVRCAAFSFLLAGLVMLLRKLFFSERTFLRGLLWLSFLLLPFLGKLKLFYENEAVLHVTWWLTAATMSWIWMDRVYAAGICVAAVCIFRKRLCLWKLVAGMEKVPLGDTWVRVTDMNVTPFTVGLLKPKIVIPRAMLENYSRDESMAVVQHEKTHIRLGHLWFGFVWDILRCLLWVNPFLGMLQKQFRADMEDICDRVCIQSSGRPAYEYGLVLLKTVKLLRRMCAGMAVAAVLAAAAMLLAVQTHSYARCNESRDIMVGNDDGNPRIVSSDTGKLAQMISYDDRCVYVEREAFEKFLEENHADGEIWIVFDGFYKLPGLAGAAEACIYEGGSTDRVVRISYESVMDHWYMKLLKLL